MESNFLRMTLSVPYEIAAVRPLRQTTLGEREEALRAAQYNTELIPQELIYVDLSTDSGVSSLSTNQRAVLTGAKFTEPGMGLVANGVNERYRREIDEIYSPIGGGAGH